MTIKPIALSALVLALLVAGGCGGGGSSSGGSTPDADLGGIWRGTAVQDGVTYDVRGFLYDDTIYLVSEQAGRLLIGKVFPDGNSWSGTIGSYVIGGSYQGTYPISGSVREQQWLRGETDSGARLDLTFDEQFKRTASLEKVAGVWEINEGEYVSSISVEPDGTFFGDSTDGCVYSGQLGVPASSQNIYRMSMTVTGCVEFAGSYNGHATLLDYLGTEDRLGYGLVGEGYVVINEFERKD